MYHDLIYNRHMFYRDKRYDYQKFCERIATSKSRCHPPPPIEYPFLRSRPKKHQMEKEKQEDIDYNKILLIKKYKSMYKKHNKYHPSNMHFLSLPPSLKFSSFTLNYYEFVRQNNYLGNKIKQIQKKNRMIKTDKPKIFNIFFCCSKIFNSICSPCTFADSPKFCRRKFLTTSISECITLPSARMM